MKSDKTWFVYTAITLSMVFWGFSYIWTKTAFVYYRPITIILFRLILSTLFLVLMNFWFKRLTKIDKKDLPHFALLTFLQPLLYFIGESYGLLQVSSIVAAVIISTIPLFSPLVAHFYLREKITRMNVLGIFISTVGVVLVIVKDDLTFTASVYGILLLMLAVLSAVVYSAVLIRLTEKYNVYTIITTQNAIGVLFFLPLFFIVDFDQFAKVGFRIEPFVPILLLAFFASSLSYMFYSFGMYKLGIARANIFANLIPIFTAFFAYIVLGETINYINMVGIVVVISGLFLSQMRKSIFAWTEDFFYKVRNNGDSF